MPHLSWSGRLLTLFFSKPILTCLAAQAPYVESVIVYYGAVAALPRAEWIDTSVLDFGLR